MGVLSHLSDGAFCEGLLEPFIGLCPVLHKAWYAVRMKLGFAKTLGVVAAFGGLAQAQCPDYTTFSQVCGHSCVLGVVVLILDASA